MSTGNPTPEEVSRAAAALGRDLAPGQASRLAVYLGLLETWNRRTNLVGPRAWPDMLTELVADSWHLADLLAGLGLPESPLTLDFGAGAGIPGLPLRAFWEAGRYVMVEPRAKRAAFLRQCAAMMRLSGVEVLEGRAEDAREPADVCLSRAFQPWREFLETCRSHLVGPECGPGGGPGDGDESALPGGGGQSMGKGPYVVVFAGEALPESPLPDGYGLVLAKAYPRRGGLGRGGQGYFWVFSPSMAAS